MITENLNGLLIHRLTQEQYEAALSAGTLDENAIYLTSEDEGGGSVGGTATGTKAGTVMLCDEPNADYDVNSGIAATPAAIQIATAPKAGLSLAAYSWDDIGYLSKLAASDPSTFNYLIGQTKDVDIEGYGTVPFQVVGIAHDTLADGTTAGFTFQAQKVFTTHNMNSSNTTTNGWGATAMRTWLNSTIYNAMAGEVKSLMKSTTVKYCKSYSNYSSVSTCSDYMWIPSYMEVFGSSSYGAEGAQYEYYADGNSKVKNNLSGSASIWWLRSVDRSAYFRCVSPGGSDDYNYASSAIGVAPCFCI